MAHKSVDKTLRVLSIDWDYFVKASMVERMTMFPDGGNENMAKVLRDIVWAGRYVTPDLEKVGVKDSTVAFTEDLMKSLKAHTPAATWVVDSHSVLYSVVKDTYKRLRKNKIELVNIDFHHDVYGQDYDVNCGNWLRVLDHELENMDNHYTWVGHADSDMEAWEDMEQGDHNGSMTFITDLNSIDLVGTKWDVVFLCRSDMWSPPHLDDNFIELADFVIGTLAHEANVQGQPCVLESRYEGLSDLIQQNRELWDRCASRLAV